MKIELIKEEGRDERRIIILRKKKIILKIKKIRIKIEILNFERFE